MRRNVYRSVFLKALMGNTRKTATIIVSEGRVAGEALLARLHTGKRKSNICYMLKGQRASQTRAKLRIRRDQAHGWLLLLQYVRSHYPFLAG